MVMVKRSVKYIIVLLCVVFISATIIILFVYNACDIGDFYLYNYKQLEVNSSVYIKTKQWGMVGNHYLFAFGTDSIDDFDEDRNILISADFFLYQEERNTILVYVYNKQNNDTLKVNDINIIVTNITEDINCEMLKKVDPYNIE